MSRHHRVVMFRSALLCLAWVWAGAWAGARNGGIEESGGVSGWSDSHCCLKRLVRGYGAMDTGWNWVIQERTALLVKGYCYIDKGVVAAGGQNGRTVAYLFI
jgi:hypothetical protein